MKYTFKELIDVPKLQELTDELYTATSIPSAIVAMDGELITGSGWQKICTDFHRKHPQIEKECIESDTIIRKKLDDSEPFVIYKCPRGLVDASSPIIIDGEHVANVFSGQVFLESRDETTERFFREQARKFGFDEAEYIKAFKKVPIFEEEKFRAGISFLAKLAKTIADNGLMQLRELVAMESVRRSAERFHTLFKQASDAFFIHDFSGGKILDANECAFKNLGYTRDELLELNVSDIEISHTPETIVEICTRAEKGSPVIVEGVHRRKDGSTFPVEISLGMLQDEDPTLLLAIVRDTTERKQTQEALRESEGRFSTMFEHMSSGVAVYESVDNGEDFVFRAFNPEAERITRISQREALGNRLLDLFPHMDKSGFLGALQRVWKTGQEEHLPPFFYKDEKREGWRENRIYKLPTGEVAALFDDITDRKQAEEALRESKEKYRALFSNAQVALFRTRSSDGKLVQINERYAKMAGYSNVEDCMAEFNAADAWANPNARNELLRILKENGSVNDFEIEIIRRNGSRIWILFSATIFPKQEFLEGSIVDINDRKQAEEALRESEERLRIQNQIANIFLTKSDEDMYGEILSVVLGIMESKFGIFGYIDEQGDLVCPSMTKDIWDQCKLSDKTIVFPEDTWGESIWGNGLRTGLSAYSNKPFKVPEGHISVERCLTTPIIYQRKSIGLFVVANKPTDYTESDKQFLEEIAEHVAPVLNARIEKERSDKAIREKAHDLNERIKELHCLHGISEIIERGLPFEEMFQEIVNRIPPAWQYPETACARILINGQSFTSSNFNTSLWNQACDITVHGERTGVLEVYYLKQIPDMDEGPFLKEERDLIISIAESLGKIMERTVTEGEKLKLETQLQQAQKMEAIGTLAGGIAHDFNNILGGIIGYAELAKMKAPEGSNIIAYLDKMIKSSDRAADLIKQILTLSRQHKQKQRPVQARHIIKETLSLLRATLPTTIEIRQDLAKDAGVVNADPTQMHQVIMNLGTNAGHAMQENGGVLEVTLANVELDDLSAGKHLDLAAGSYLRLTVSDTGHGMTSEIRERIFDPYFTTKDTGEGTGLGLSVAHGIVKTYGGTITVYSEPGEGTTFHVYLPIILELEREEKESEEPHPTGSECILFIDDEEVLVEIGGQILEQLGYKVVTETSSVQALELFRAEPNRFDLVITDMTMPHMTGDKLARELMTIRPKIPIILCTGHSGLVSEAKAEEIGIKAFVMKPLVMRNLAETVRKVLDAGRSEV